MEFKSNTKQRIKTIQGLRSFKNTLPTKIKKIISKKGHIFSETLDNWRNIVGDDLFKICYPKSFKYANKFGVSCLNIMVKRGCEVDVEYSKNIILDNMNAFFGQKIVEKIKFLTFEDMQEKFYKKKDQHVTKSKYLKKLSNIKNKKIKNSLIELTKVYKKK